jgi:hypothetical protein
MGQDSNSCAWISSATVTSTALPPSQVGRHQAFGLSATLEGEAVATLENEAIQTDWLGDLSGGLGVNPAAGRGRGSAAAGGSRSWHRAVDGRAGGRLGRAAEV